MVGLYNGVKGDGMKATKKRVSDVTVDELKAIIHEVIAEDITAWKETFEIMTNKKLMSQIRQADADWQSGKKGAYILWDRLKRV
jgi:hypothetical protein